MGVESSQRIPPLVLVHVVVPRVLHGVDALLAGLDTLEVRTAPAPGVHPGCKVVPQRPVKIERVIYTTLFINTIIKLITVIT